MDILNITPQVGGSIYQGATPAIAKPVMQPPAPEIKVEQVKVPSTAEQARYEEVLKAAQAIQSNYFVVSDTRFTIFKDIAGDYVTRFTSLKDGSVKYYPQKSLFELMKIKHAQLNAAFNTEA